MTAVRPYVLPLGVLLAGVLGTWYSFAASTHPWLPFVFLTVAAIGLLAFPCLALRRSTERDGWEAGDLIAAVAAVAGTVLTVQWAEEPVIFLPPYLLTWLGGGFLLARLAELLAHTPPGKPSCRHAS